MKICLVHNEYGRFSGEEAVVAGQVELLKTQGHGVVCFFRSSAEIPTMFMGQVRAFFSGIYNPFSKKDFRDFLRQERPDIVHIHNLFPLISPAILDVCCEMKLPVVMTVHNYRLVCPTGLCMVDDNICEECCGGHEYACILRNCTGSYLKSIGYAVRNAVTRLRKTFSQNVTLYLVLSNFQKNKMEQAGFPPNRVVVVPNMCAREGAEFARNQGEYIAYLGRISREKGGATLVDAMKLCPDIPCRIAGNDTRNFLSLSALPNCQSVGFLMGGEVSAFLLKCRFLVFPSICYETFGLSMVEAMLRGKPVIASRLGGIPEIVEDGVTGLLFEPGGAEDLAQKMKYLWERPDLCDQMGAMGREKALKEYSPEKYYQRLIEAYRLARELPIAKDARPCG